MHGPAPPAASDIRQVKKTAYGNFVRCVVAEHRSKREDNTWQDIPHSHMPATRQG